MAENFEIHFDRHAGGSGCIRVPYTTAIRAEYERRGIELLPATVLNGVRLVMLHLTPEQASIALDVLVTVYPGQAITMDGKPYTLPHRNLAVAQAQAREVEEQTRNAIDSALACLNAAREPLLKVAKRREMAVLAVRALRTVGIACNMPPRIGANIAAFCQALEAQLRSHPNAPKA